ncbi:YmfL family putative regulatory protein [Providencia rettgeri]
MCNQTLREVVKGMCKGYPNGRAGMAGALGMSENTFNNKLYEKNGCRFFENGELEKMEQLSGTTLLVDYHMSRHQLIAPQKIESTNLDRVDLFEIRMNLDAMNGSLFSLMQKCILDGAVTEENMRVMKNKLRNVFSYTVGFVDSFETVFKAEKQ